MGSLFEGLDVEEKIHEKETSFGALDCLGECAIVSHCMDCQLYVVPLQVGDEVNV